MLPPIHPWRRLRALTHITLLWHDGGPKGITDFVNNTISLRRGMTHDERRSTVLHECLHVERGPTLDTLEAREELRVERLAARMLLPDIRVVGEAMAWGRSDAEAAWELSVDVDILAARLDALHGWEYFYLRKRLAED